MNEYPDLSLFLQNLWLRENAIGLEAIEGKGGYSNGKYYPYKTPNGNIDVGPGFDMDKQTPEFRKRAAKGFTKEELDNMVLSIARNELPYFRKRIVREGGDPDKVTGAIYNGLLDMYWQLKNGLYGYDNFWKAVASGDYEGMRNESATYYSPKNGKIPKGAIVKDGKILDTGRWDFRKTNYFKDPEILSNAVNDAVVQTNPIMEPAFDESMYVEQPNVIRNYKPVVFPSNTRMNVREGMQNKIDFNNFMDSIRIQNNLQTYNFPIQFNKAETTKNNQYDKGGSLKFPQWDNLSIREKAAMMRTAVSNGITNIDDIRREYNEFAEGGPKKSWTMEDEANYRQWRNSLPDNLKYTDDNIYDMVGAYQAGMQPTLEGDGKYHLGSRDPQTGKILKAPYHPTYLQALNEDARIGYYPTLTTNGTYTDTWKGNIPKEIQVPYRPYAKGGNLFAEGGPTRKEIEDLFWQNRMDEAQAALSQVPQKAPTPIIDRELPELTVYPQRNYPDPYSIPQGEITPVTGNALSRAINNYTGELKYDLANNRVPSGKYTLPAAVLGATGLAGLAKAGEMAYAAGATPLIMEGMNVPFTASGLSNLVNGNADWQTALEIAPLGHYVMPIAKRIYPRLAPKIVDKYAAIKEAYNRNPEISKVGSIDDYNDYLKTVFPESKIQDIQYHMGPRGIEELKGSTGEIWNTNPKAKGIYVSPTKEYPELIRKHTTDRIEKPSALKYLWRNLTGNWDKANAKYTEMYPVLINTKNPLYTSGNWTWGMNQNKYDEVFSNYDGIVNSGTKWYQRAYEMPETIVPSSDQTLILGSNRDLQGFKQFMSKRTSASTITPEDAVNGIPENTLVITPQITAENDIVASLNTEVNSKLPPAIKAVKAMKAADNDIKAMNAYHDANVAAYNEATGSSVKSIPFRTDTGGRRVQVLPKEDFDAAYLEGRSNAPRNDVGQVGGFYRFGDDTVYLRQNGSPSNAYHEFLHSDKYGITNPEVTKWRIDQLVDPEKIKSMSPELKSYYLSETEFPVHLRQQGENLGIKVGDPFPGEEAFDEMLLNTGHGGSSVYVKGMSTDASLEDKKLAWKALNGTLFNYGLPALGITTAATLSNQKALGGNLFAKGGIHIKPSHRGRLTELNARNWHDLGGNLYAMGTPLTEEQRRALARQYFWENKMDKAQQYAVPSIYEGGDLPEVAVTAERLPFEYQNVAPTDNTFVAGTGRTQNPQAIQRAIQGGEQLNAWHEAHPVLSTIGTALGAAPFAVAATPLLSAVGEAAAPVLANPYVDAALTSGFGAHGLNHAINEGINGIGDAAMTALELVPLGRLAKPMFNEAALAIENYRYPLGRPQVPKNFLTIKPQVRTRVGDVEVDNPNLLYHLDRGDGAGAFSTQGAYVEDGFLFPGTPKDASATPYSWWNKGKPYATAVQGQPMTRLMTTTEDAPGMLHIRSQNYPIGQWNGKRGLVTNAEYANPEKVDVSGSTYTLDPNYGWRKVFPEETSVAEWTMGKTAPQITAENAASITPEQWTAAQDAAIARGDMVEAQRLRDLHFKVSAPDTKVVDSTGYPLTVYHGTTPKGDYILRHNGVTYGPNTDNMFFTSNYYGQYLGDVNSKSVPVYINAKKIGDAGNHYEIGNSNPRQYLKEGEDALYEWGFMKHNDFVTDEAFEKAAMDALAKEEAFAASKGIKELPLEGEGDIGEFTKILYEDVNKRGIGDHPILELAVPNGEQVKLADAVTYDDKGIRIPLGERDNFNINDIRYALLPTLGIGAMGTLFNQKALGGNLFADGGITYDGGTLPELQVTGYAPIRLTTYYPVVSKFPYTGHSKLEIPIDTTTWNTYKEDSGFGEKTSPYLTINKGGSSRDYNLLTNNCADATLSYLNSAFNTEESPILFTTPGDVRDYAINTLGGKVIEGTEKGSDIVLIPRDVDNYKQLSKDAVLWHNTHDPHSSAFSLKGPLKYNKRHSLGGNLFDIGRPQNPPIKTTGGAGYVPSVDFSSVTEDITNIYKYLKNYFSNKLSEKDRSAFIDLSNKNVSRIKKDTKGVETILTNEFVEDNDNTIKTKKQFKNTTDTLLGDRKIPLSKISTFYGIEDGKLKAGSLDDFKDETVVIPNRAKNVGKVVKVIAPLKDERKKSYKIFRDSVSSSIDTYNKKRGYKPDFLTKLGHLVAFEKPSPFATLHDNTDPKEYRHVTDSISNIYRPILDKTQLKVINEKGDTISGYSLNATPKALFANEQGNAVFVSDLHDNERQLNDWLKENPSYPIMVDNGRYGNFMLSGPNIGEYIGFGNPDKAFVLGTTKKSLGGNLYPKGGSLNPSVLRAMKYFMDRGFTDYQAAGFVGNLMRESSMDPNALNKWSNAFGLAQWLGDRRNTLFAMYGPKPTFEQQLDFIWHELNTTHKNGLKYILASKDAEEAARNTMGYYEFSAGPEGAIAAMNKHKQNGQASMDRGIEFAKQFYGYYNPMSLDQQKPQDPVLAAKPMFNVNSMDNTYVEKPRYYDIPMSTPVNEQYSPEVLAREQARDNLNTLATVLGILDTHSKSPVNILKYLAI